MSLFTAVNSAVGDDSASDDEYVPSRLPKRRKESIDMIISNLRRPQTKDTRKFYHVSAAKWAEWIKETSNPARTKQLLNQLRKFDSAGRIMETNEGAPALESCYWCNRDDSITCMLFADGHEKACGYCRRMGKAGCTASLTPRPRSFEERVTELEEKLGVVTTRLEATTEQLETTTKQLETTTEQLETTTNQLETTRKQLQASLSRITALETKTSRFETTDERIAVIEDQQAVVGKRLNAAFSEFRRYYEDVQTIWRHLWPSAEEEDSEMG